MARCRLRPRAGRWPQLRYRRRSLGLLSPARDPRRAGSAATSTALSWLLTTGRKRNEGKGHKQPLLALARRRANVLGAMIRDGACYEALPTVTAAARRGRWEALQPTSLTGDNLLSLDISESHSCCRMEVGSDIAQRRAGHTYISFEKAGALLRRKYVMARLGDCYSALTRRRVGHPVIGLQITF